MSLLIKICGLKTPDALDAALSGGADLVGFVFFEKSPRHLDLDTARKLSAQVGGRAAKVALVACMRKLLTILNAMVRSNTPWQPA